MLTAALTELAAHLARADQELRTSSLLLQQAITILSLSSTSRATSPELDSPHQEPSDKQDSKRHPSLIA